MLASLDSASPTGIPAAKSAAILPGSHPSGLTEIAGSVAVDAALVHNHYCLNDTRATELLPAVLEKGIGLINGSPFGSGLLTGREPTGWHPAEESDRRCFREAAAFCHRQGVPISKLAIQFASRQPNQFASQQPKKSPISGSSVPDFFLISVP
ncbi:MAG: aldo/keto reductase [Isosphaeraceae bacterium]